jgi:L-aminopeptidase/D-esterase-like protein
VGLLGEKNARIIGIMEIVFANPEDRFPIYHFEHKLDFVPEVRFDVPARLDAALQAQIESVARGTYKVLGCRDVARIDLRMDDRGTVHFIECNPLPGLSPGFSDLCLISEACGMTFASLIEQILAPAIGRFEAMGAARQLSAGSRPSMTESSDNQGKTAPGGPSACRRLALGRERRTACARRSGIGHFEPGPNNAITGRPGVGTCHADPRAGRLWPAGAQRTGDGILPNEGNVFEQRVVGGGFILNGAGEVSGLTQVIEWGLIETPILLTSTLSVGTCSAALVQYMVEKYPSIGRKHDVIIPLVGECDDSWLNDAGGNHITVDHVYEAIASASDGVPAEGNVGAGTGMVTCDFAGGIGTSSRVLPREDGGYTLGVLVLSNFGHLVDLRFDGIPVGEILAPHYGHIYKRRRQYGSIIAVVATNAPLWTHQLSRISKRVALGIGRVGSYAAHASGEIMFAFSTANTLPREKRSRSISSRSRRSPHGRALSR